jgi:hypothetical protein
LPGPTLEVAHWGRAAALGAALCAESDGVGSVEPRDATERQPGLKPAPPADEAPASADPAGLRAAVAATLNALAWRIEETLPGALAAAPTAWDRVDNLLSFFDPPLTAHLAQVRRRLELAAASREAPPAVRAVAIEGLLALEAACGLARLCEQRLSSLIRLRVRSGIDELLPAGRPFLDLAPALKEAARAWA